MKSTIVIDAGVLALHFAQDPRVAEYFDKIDEENARGLVTSVNLAEFYYKTCKKLGRQAADTGYFLLRASKLQAVYDDALNRLAGPQKDASSNVPPLLAKALYICSLLPFSSRFSLVIPAEVLEPRINFGNVFR